MMRKGFQKRMEGKIRMELEDKQLLLMIVFQLIEMNRLMKKLNYISGTDEGLSMDEIKGEIEFLAEFADCISKKGTLCPISGIVKKVTKHIGKEEEVKE